MADIQGVLENFLHKVPDIWTCLEKAVGCMKLRRYLEKPDRVCYNIIKRKRWAVMEDKLSGCAL